MLDDKDKPHYYLRLTRLVETGRSRRDGRKIEREELVLGTRLPQALYEETARFIVKLINKSQMSENKAKP